MDRKVVPHRATRKVSMKKLQERIDGKMIAMMTRKIKTTKGRLIADTIAISMTNLKNPGIGAPGRTMRILTKGNTIEAIPVPEV